MGSSAIFIGLFNVNKLLCLCEATFFIVFPLVIGLVWLVALTAYQHLRTVNRANTQCGWLCV